LQLVALHLGSLSVVQPLLIAGLLFALVFRGLHDPREISARQLGWAVVVCVALGTFVALAAAGTDTAPVDKLPAVVAAATGAVLAAGCIALGRRMTPGGGAAAVLGVAVGLVYAGTAALLKVVSAIIASDPLHLLVSWQFYLVIVLGATGLMLNQLAFQAGPLAASLPATASIDPLASVAVGVAVFDERIRSLGGSAVSLVAILLVLGLAVVQLSRATPTTPSTESPG
jgi:drug/metabolite transporter (DMT)-like permease